MGLFDKQFANVVEWQEYREDVIFWKWNNSEIKKGSRLIIRAGQDALFMYNGKLEGVFTDEGSYDIESEIIPFLSTLKGFKFGFNSGIRVEVLFINVREFLIKWGTKNAINIPAPSLPGGMPIRAFGSFSCKVTDYVALIDKIAGIKNQYTVDDIKDRVLAQLDPLLMKWISREGKDLFNLQANAAEISKGIQMDLDMDLMKIGISISEFIIQSVSYPEEVQKMVNKTASHSMVGDMNRYQQVSAVESMGKSGSSAASDMVGWQMGMAMGKQMVDDMTSETKVPADRRTGSQSSQPAGSQNTQQAETAAKSDGSKPNFCPNCGQKATGANFCPNCGHKLA